ncbi:sialic acid-binding Ig-like lectin 13 isoform X1 [Salarias fasciatus]|uniref:sialic acid-binding Ig-like lectin 13 isoform X1 n=1 Tax=Salarias fasciatus TaxID=181472 RepID=UPI001176C576|nr:sialic acid-binding Ig-like lectin 13 isoform X1 [Salarias fasciatus]
MPVLSFMWALCVNMMTVNMFLSLFFLSGAADACRYRSELDVKTPQKMEALSGSCLKIPCSFDNPKRFDGTRETSAMWIRDSPSRPRNIVYDSGRTKNKYPMNITGNLREKNCTTEFFNLTTDYTHSYYFRLINLPFKATAPCNPLEITVKDSPPRPTLQVSGDLNDLKEKESVTITCSAPTPCPHLPPRLTWSLQQDAHSQTEENTDGTLTTKIQQNITLSDQHDGFNLSCSAVYPVDGGKHVKTAVAELSLNVSYAPKNTSASISPSGLVSAGSWVNLSCSSRARPAVSYTWFKISDHGAVRVSEGDFYSFNVTEGGVYYCVAANHLGNQTSEQILLIVADLSLHLNTMIGVVIGIIVFICLLLGIYIFMCWIRKKNTNSTVQVGQSQTGEELAAEEPAEKPQEEGENIHYGEIDFSKQKPEPFSKSEIRSKQEDTVYAEVRGSQPGNSSTHTADHPEDLNALYAEMKEKSEYSVGFTEV